MSSLVAPRPPGWRMREDEARQGSLFGGEALAPARGNPPRPASPRAAAPAHEAPARDLVPPDEGADAIRVSRAALAGPTLDDAVSRAWEGLVAGMAAACPVCRRELEPAHGGGRCDTCHITLD